MASHEGHDKVGSLLLQAGADHRIGTKDGFTPLHIASHEGHDKVASLTITNWG